jgi:hypothetical protein
MSLLEAPEATIRSAAPALVATRRLTVLDELRVPYEHVDGSGSLGPWASLCAAEPSRAMHWFVGDGDPAAGWSLGSLQIWGRVAPDDVVAEFATSLAGEWMRESPILDASGVRRSCVWRSSEGATILPFDPDELIANLRSERYLRLRGSRRLSLKAFARRTYYALRPVTPRRVQIAVRRAFSRIQARTPFPRWPVEPALHDMIELVLRRVADSAGAPVPYIASWPQGRSWALVLTHDVETAVGRDAIEMVRAVEEAAGFRSSWNLVPERYRVDDELVEHLKSVGCEVGVHGLRHDGRDLESLRTLERRLTDMRRWARRWGAVGFRSPATHRVWEWMPKLGFDYDTSYPDTDPYEPMAGGCCSWLPFFNEGMVELPITLQQDHTVFVILRRDESVWFEKTALLRGRGGMALALIHPDYMLEPDRLRAYARFLRAFRDDPAVWTPLPCEVADWWRRRAATSLRLIDGHWQASGPAEDEVAIAFAEPTIVGAISAAVPRVLV